MNLQVQTSLIDQKKGGSTTQLVKPVTIDKMDQNHLASEGSSVWLNGKESETRNIDESKVESNYGQKSDSKTVERKSNNNEESGNDAVITAAYDQHRQFLQKYKIQRGDEIRLIRQKYYLNSCFDQRMEEEQEDSEQDKGQQNNVYMLVIGERMKQIHSKIQKDIIAQNIDCDKIKYKIFSGVVTSKNDLERISKERRFVRSQQQKHIDYEQPEMPFRHKMPLQYRVNTQSIETQTELCRKARNFIERIHRQQQNLLGKQILRKKNEENKRQRSQKYELRKKQELNEIKKQERKMKAEQNLLMMKEKVKISQIINSNSIHELRKILAEKQKRLESIRQNIKETESNSRVRAMPKRYRDRIKTEVVNQNYKSQDFEQGNKLKGMKESNDRNNKSKDRNIRVKLKLGLKKYKLLKPTQYRQNTEYTEGDNEFLNKKSDVSPLKSSRSATFQKEDNSLKPGYRDSQMEEDHIKEDDIQQNRELKQRSYTQYVQMSQNTFGMVGQRPSLKQRQKMISNSALQ